MTQKQLAAELGVSVTAVSKWENDISHPDIPILCAMADFFQVTTDELLGREGTRRRVIIFDPVYGKLETEKYGICGCLTKPFKSEQIEVVLRQS